MPKISPAFKDVLLRQKGVLYTLKLDKKENNHYYGCFHYTYELPRIESIACLRFELLKTAEPATNTVAPASTQSLAVS